jgi:peptide-methionine (S)-S-oxide reductase
MKLFVLGKQVTHNLLTIKGHAEVIQIDFDPKIITFEDLCSCFFISHDPTQLNRQGNDVGTQYR